MNDLAPRCLCGRCDAACWYKPFVSCCGACADGTPFEQVEIVWPLPPVLSEGGAQ